MKRIVPYWILLSFYFVISCFLLVINSNQSIYLPYILISLPLVLLFINPAKKSGSSILVFIVLSLFVVLHAVPMIPVLQAHHQSSSEEQHPCCMPQMASLVIFAMVMPLFMRRSLFKDKSNGLAYATAYYTTNPRAPPQVF